MSKGGKFNDLIDGKMENLDIWIKKLVLARKDSGEKIPHKIYSGIKKYVKEAFIHDYNLIIEEYDFFYLLPPHLQSSVNSFPHFRLSILYSQTFNLSFRRFSMISISSSSMN
jgi:hypothetical protein